MFYMGGSVRSCGEIAAKTDEQMTEFAQSSDGKRAANLKKNSEEDEKALRHNKANSEEQSFDSDARAGGKQRSGGCVIFYRQSQIS